MPNISAQIQELLTSHITTIIEEGKGILSEAEQAHPSMVDLSEATHKIKGGSGTAGFMDICEISTVMNDRFKALARDGGDIDDDMKANLEKFRLLLSSIKPEDSALWKKYVAE